MKRSLILRLSLYQFWMGAVSVLMLGTLNRILRVEMGLDLALVGVTLGGAHYLAALVSIPIGHRSDAHPYFGYHRLPYIVAGTALAVLAVATAPFVAAFLASSGVNVIVKGEEAFGEDTICELPLLAAFAIKRGLDRTGALRANTLNVPDVLGVADRIGHIELGKDADLVVFAGDPFHYRTVVKSVFIDGISVNEYRQ